MVCQVFFCRTSSQRRSAFPTSGFSANGCRRVSRVCRQFEPDGGRGEVDGGKEISGGFVVARGDCPELLELAEEILDQVTLFVEFAIELARRRAVWSRRDYRKFAGRGQRVEDPAIGIEGAICDQQVGGHMRQQRIGPGQVVRLSRRQQQAQRIAERVDQRMDLGAQTAAAAAKCLVLNFF